MNKSKIFTVALACILGLSACVDDKESASVENVRNAKAAQLNALAAYNLAQGEAAKMNAEADKLVKEAEAASKNQSTEQSKQRFEILIESLKAEAAEATARAKKMEQEMIEEMQKDSQDHVTNVLFTNYQTANTALQDLNDNLFNEQISLIGLQADVVSYEAQVAKKIIGYKQTIAEQEAIKTALKALPSNNLAAAKAAAEKNKIEAKGIDDRLAAATSAKSKATSAYTAAVTAVTDTKTSEQATFLNTDYPSDKLVEIGNITPKDADGNTASGGSYQTYTFNSERIRAKAIFLKENSLSYDPALGKADGSEAGTLYAVLKDAKAAEATAKTAAEATGATQADRAAYTAAIVATQDAEDAIVQNREDKARSLVAYDKLIAAQAAITADATIYAAAITAAEAAGQTSIVTGLALTPITAEKTANTALQATLDALAGGLTDIATAIAGCDETIASTQKFIVTAEGINSKEQAVAKSEEAIKNYKLEIAAQELIVKSLKAQLDAELAA